MKKNSDFINKKINFNEIDLNNKHQHKKNNEENKNNKTNIFDFNKKIKRMEKIIQNSN